MNLENSHRAASCTAVVCAGLLAGCVTQGKYDELLDERNALSTQNEQLRRGAGQLAREGAQLARVVTDLSEELALRDVEITQLEREQEELAEEFDAFITAGTIKMQLLKDGLHLILSEDILFGSGSAELHQGGQEVLVKLVDELEHLPYQIGVLGYTDNVPVGASLAARYPSNWELAGARSAAVVRLMEEHEIPSEQLAVVSFGSTRPIASNDTPEGRAENRRIEIRLRPVVVTE